MLIWNYVFRSSRISGLTSPQRTANVTGPAYVRSAVTMGSKADNICSN